MLQTLRIDNFALIERAELHFGPGLTVVTGETGAGKSIMLDAFLLLLGARSSKDLIRRGKDSLVVEGVFIFPPEHPTLAHFRAAGIPYLEDGEVIIRRELSARGNTCQVNRMTLPVGALAELSEVLVDIHGQHDHQSLLRPSYHRECLDAFGKLGAQVAEVEACYAAWREVSERLANLEARHRERERTLDLLKYQFEEIEAAALDPDEEPGLEEEFQMLNHAEHLQELLGGMVAALTEDDGSVMERLGRVGSDLSQAARLIPSLSEHYDTVEAARIELQVVARQLEHTLAGIEVDPQRLEEVIQRQETLKRLKRKYGATLAEVLAYQAEIGGQIAELENAESSQEQLSAELVRRELALRKASLALSTARRECAQAFQTKVCAELDGLHMARNHLEVAFTERGELTREHFAPHGIDQVEFLFAPNPGIPPRPLRKIASGGELSRVMLALKSVLAGADTVPTLVFDEIDSGIGGEVGNAVGRKLAALAKHHQLISISHLPQIARYAETHLLVAKDEAEGMTTTTITPLDGENRVQELARLLSGRITTHSLEHARQLLAEE